MQTIEALISLEIFLIAGVSIMLMSIISPVPVDDSLYGLQLAGDAWRVLYLRGDFTGLSDDGRGAIENDMREMGEGTGLCFFISGVEFTNCRDQENHPALASVSRTVFINGIPRRVSFSIAK